MKKRHYRKQITRTERIVYLTLASSLLIYGIISFRNGGLYLPSKFGGGVVFHGMPHLTLLLSMLCFVTFCFLKLVGHYDEKENGWLYMRFTRLTSYLGFALFIAALLMDTFIFKNSSSS